MTSKQLKRRYRRKWIRWFCIRWGVVAGIVYVCFFYIYPRRLINDSPDILALLAAHQADQWWARLTAPIVPLLHQALQWLLIWLPERTVLPFLYPTLAPYINAGVEYPWLLFLALCMAASVTGSFLIMLLWRFLSRRGIRAAQRAKRAVWLFFAALILVLALNFCTGSLVFMFWANGRQLATCTIWDWLMHLGAFIAVPAVSLLSAWRAAPSRIGGKGSFFR